MHAADEREQGLEYDHGHDRRSGFPARLDPFSRRGSGATISILGARLAVAVRQASAAGLGERLERFG